MENAELAAILADYVAKDDHEAALAALEETIAERDAARDEAQKHSGRLAELEGKVRGRSWRDAYDKVAEELKVDPRFRGDVYELAKITPDADEPDPARIRRSVEDFLKGREGYVQAGKGPEAERPRSIPAGDGHGRGASGRPGDPEFVATRAQLADASYMRQNQRAIAQAQRDGRFRIDETF